MNKKKVIVIGSGFAGLSAASNLAKAGYEVTVLEKNSMAGGRCRVFAEKGFTFDMGPSWYWMPDVFDRYFEGFNKKTSDYYDLVRLNPSYSVFFEGDENWEIPADMSQLEQLFESVEKGAAEQLRKFLADAKYKYEVGINDLVHKPSRNLTEFISLPLLIDVFKLDVFGSIHKQLRKYFTNPKLLQLMEFPVLFLGATPQNTPALYSLMNYADMSLGTWYPMGGMYKIVEGMQKLAEELGVKFIFNEEVIEIKTSVGEIQEIHTKNNTYQADVIVAAADYQHVDRKLLQSKQANYSEKYWNSRVLAPSSLLFYIGLNTKVPNLQHHNLFFDEDFSIHANEIYTQPQWPSKPLFYASAPSKTDPSVAPEGYENLFLLIPVATDVKQDTEEIREKYFNFLADRLLQRTGVDIRNHIVYKRSYAHSDFKADYHAFKGNAYGLANTLMQTAILKPSIKNKHLKNLFYTGQLTVPGPGVPPSLISGEVVAKEIMKEFPI